MSPQSTVHSPQQVLEEKRKCAEAILEGFERVIVAFSGGVDSTLLAKLARDVLRTDRVLAVTADSPSLSRLDLEETKRLAGSLDLQHLVIQTNEVSQSSYRANTSARCYFCRHELFQALQELATARKIPVVLYGAIGDDRLDERPGQRAAVESGVRAPLQEAGLKKGEVRELARSLGLPNWDRPQNACLSSRIPHGLEVTEAKLSAIERAETLLLGLGFRQVRVRHLGTHARIEVGREEVDRFQDTALRQQVAEQLAGFGFRS
ncbi:MAG: ATP-dependent sacrificial sulfur transferase LarE, partial [Candidatus Omnitrophica bacterium]|nr:ATP-dependent sacrificial sulfur transferase LarE [Candidatus Omnitrophota bacterium]